MLPPQNTAINITPENACEVLDSAESDYEDDLVDIMEDQIFILSNAFKSFVLKILFQ